MKTADDLADAFAGAEGIILADYRGLTTAQLNELRSALRGDAAFTVTKNTYAKIAAARTGLGTIADLFTGPSAVAVIHGDPAATAKALLDFAKVAPLELKGGYLQGSRLDLESIRILADTPPRETLLAMLAGAMQAPMAKAAAAFLALKEKSDG